MLRFNRALVFSRLLVAIVALALGQPTLWAVDFADTTFNNSDWSSTVLDATAGTTTSAVQQGAGGNPGAFRRMTHNLPGVSAAYVFHEYLPASYNLAAGPITLIDYSEDHIEFNPPFGGAKIGWAAALRQGGTVYHTALNETPNTSWETGILNNLTALDFTEFNGTAHPDFSINGLPVHFGYLRWNTHFAGPITIDQGIDNWRVSAVPEPSSLLALTFLAPMLVIRRKRRSGPYK